MRRRHLFELHEQTWCPPLWRRMFQQGLGVAQGLLDIYRHMGIPLSRFLHRTGATSVLDLCSGSAEPLVRLRSLLGEPLAEPQKIKFVVSDLYPDVEKFQRLKEQYPDDIDYYPHPVDALSPPPDAPRVRTMLSSLHHFRPEQVKGILRDAAENADGIAILESTGRTWPNMLLTLPLPLPAAIITAFLLRPFRFWHLVWGLLIPAVPLIALFDGIVSNLRTYTVEELRGFTREIDVPGFVWEVGAVDVPGVPLKATYLLGCRERPASAAGQTASRGPQPLAAADPRLPVPFAPLRVLV